MERILDNIIIFICCSVFLFSFGTSKAVIASICISIIYACLTIYFDKFIINLFLFIAVLLLVLLSNTLTYYIPLFCYPFFHTSYTYVCVPAVFVLYLHNDELNILAAASVLLLSVLSFILKIRTDSYLEDHRHFEEIRQNLKDYNTNLNLKNRELIEKQDYEVTNATLNERNRIAREIHDSIGHTLSSSILQLAALTAVVRDEQIASHLKEVNDRLTDGMNSIRASIHNIHEESVDLNLKIREMVNSFDFCPIDYIYDVEQDFSSKAKYALIYIVRESLTNIMKYSNATHVSLNISELPGFYKIIIHDNGTAFSSSSVAAGMGTVSMYDRINSLGGTINITKNNGYRIYITIPVETKITGQK
ncbi:MAG: hypothetical protein HFI34_08540 [Lachnospiraceae bacterium]|nr:hypothetical protein [Lachnospiraceae bacterium]